MEMEILRLLCQGMTNKEIGQYVFLSKSRIDAYVTSIYRKIGVDSRHAAIIRANNIGLISSIDETAFDRLYKKHGPKR